MPSNSRQLIITLTTGIESPEKLSQAFTVAATAVASGARVSLWLTGESAWLAVPRATHADRRPIWPAPPVSGA